MRHPFSYITFGSAPFVLGTGAAVTAAVVAGTGATAWGCYALARWWQARRMAASATRNGVTVGIIGAGFSGLSAAHRLQKLGVPFTIYERHDSPGGTWFENKYPGCACDVPAILYSFSFSLNSFWSRKFAPAGEILSYIRGVVKKFGLDKHIRYRHNVKSTLWVEEEGHWEVTTEDVSGRVETHKHTFLIMAVGPLSIPQYPDGIEGFGSFRGPALHTARWPDDGLDQIRGRTVAVIGSGATAAQVVPAIQPMVKKLYSVQRTPAWESPRDDFDVPRWMCTLVWLVPGLTRAIRFFMWAYREAIVYPAVRSPDSTIGKTMTSLVYKHMREVIPGDDPASVSLRQRLTPSYKIACKRILVSDDYWVSFTKENVVLEQRRIARFVPEGLVVRGDDGSEETINVDAIIYATGYKVFGSDPEHPVAKSVRGVGGKTLGDTFRPYPVAYKSVFHPMAPNGFVILGPNSGLGHNSIVIMAECAVNLIEHMLRATLAPYPWQRVGRPGRPRVQVTEAALADYDKWVEGELRGTVWESSVGGCQSWYQVNGKGRVYALWPRSTQAFWWHTLSAPLSHFHITQAS